MGAPRHDRQSAAYPNQRTHLAQPTEGLSVLRRRTGFANCRQLILPLRAYVLVIELRNGNLVAGRVVSMHMYVCTCVRKSGIGHVTSTWNGDYAKCNRSSDNFYIYLFLIIYTLVRNTRLLQQRLQRDVIEDVKLRTHREVVDLPSLASGTSVYLNVS